MQYGWTLSVAFCKKIETKIPVFTVTCMIEKVSVLGFNSITLTESIKVCTVPFHVIASDKSKRLPSTVH